MDLCLDIQRQVNYHKPDHASHHHYSESDQYWKVRSSSSSSSSSSEESVESVSSTQKTSDGFAVKEIHVPEFYEIEVDSEMIYWTKNNGDDDMCEISDWKQVLQRQTDAERVRFECSVFGQEVEHLMPSTSKRRPELQDVFYELQMMVGLPFNKNGNPTPKAAIGRAMISVTFGCNDFPSNFMGKTLTAWREDSRKLEYVSISWRSALKNREEAVDAMAKHWQLPLSHIWKYSKHDDSMYALAYFDDEEKLQKAEKDSANIYLLYAKNEERMAVLSISDYALTLHCASRQKWEAVPILKRAFNEATNIKDTFYSIIDDRMNKEVLT